MTKSQESRYLDMWAGDWKEDNVLERIFEDRAMWLSQYGKDEDDVRWDAYGREYVYGEEEDSFDGYKIMYLPEGLAFKH